MSTTPRTLWQRCDRLPFLRIEQVGPIGQPLTLDDSLVSDNDDDR